MKKTLICIFILSLFFNASFASRISQDLEFSNLRIRLMPAVVLNTAGFMEIRNKSSKDYYLVKIESQLAASNELHTHITEDGMMKMREVSEIKISANSTTSLKPGSFHMMFMKLKKKLVENESEAVTLVFRSGEKITLDIPIKKI